MTRVLDWLKARVPRDHLREDSVAGVVLGVQSIPDGLAGGLLAGVNPVFGLYGYMVGTFTGALFTGAAFMAVQATGAMAMVISDIPGVHTADNPDRALFTLAIVTGAIMLVAGFFKLGTILRWVSNSVMVGFINAVGINIALTSSGSSTTSVATRRKGQTALPARSTSCSTWARPTGQRSSSALQPSL